MEKIKVLHIITSLHADGAQHMLLKLSQNRDEEKFEYEVISMLDLGVIGKELKKSGVLVHELKLSKLKNFLPSSIKLIKVIRKFEPKIIQGWMYHGNLLAFFITKLLFPFRKMALVWNIRRDLETSEHDKFSTKCVIKLNAFFSKHASVVIHCAEKVLKDHVKIGFLSANSRIINNGFDLSKFYPSLEDHLNFKKEFDIPQSSRVIGMVGRFHSQKNHHNFVRMAELVEANIKDVVFVLIGAGCDLNNTELRSWIRSVNLSDKFFLLGQRRDVAKLLRGFDVFCLSSSLEGFPNVLGEAMASGVVCVSTKAGAAEEIIKDKNRIAPINDAEALADKVLGVLSLSLEEKAILQVEIRNQIISNYDIKIITKSYEDLYGSLSKP